MSKKKKKKYINEKNNTSGKISAIDLLQTFNL